MPLHPRSRGRSRLPRGRRGPGVRRARAGRRGARDRSRRGGSGPEPGNGGIGRRRRILRRELEGRHGRHRAEPLPFRQAGLHRRPRGPHDQRDDVPHRGLAHPRRGTAHDRRRTRLPPAQGPVQVDRAGRGQLRQQVPRQTRAARQGVEEREDDGHRPGRRDGAHRPEGTPPGRLRRSGADSGVRSGNQRRCRRRLRGRGQGLPREGRRLEGDGRGPRRRPQTGVAAVRVGRRPAGVLAQARRILRLRAVRVPRRHRADLRPRRPVRQPPARHTGEGPEGDRPGRLARRQPELPSLARLFRGGRAPRRPRHDPGRRPAPDGQLRRDPPARIRPDHRPHAHTPRLGSAGLLRGGGRHRVDDRLHAERFRRGERPRTRRQRGPLPDGALALRAVLHPLGRHVRGRPGPLPHPLPLEGDDPQALRPAVDAAGGRPRGLAAGQPRPVVVFPPRGRRSSGCSSPSPRSSPPWPSTRDGRTDRSPPSA